MKDDLAQALLGRVMDWEGPDAADELEILQVLARYKYDEYQRFEPGRKFVESFALWLDQFRAGEERQTAYDFVRRRLVFTSNSELNHLVSSLYPDVIRPIIRDHSAAELQLPTFRVSAIESTDMFARLHRESAFLALSDGARIDMFRRSSRQVDNEQVHATYEVELGRREAMHEDLIEDLRAYQADSASGGFRLVFLIDDFSGSGKTLLRKEGNVWKGRIERFARLLRQDALQESPVFAGGKTSVYVCLYISTQQALDYLAETVGEFPDPPWSKPPVVRTLQVLGPESKVTPDGEIAFDRLLNRYYDPTLLDKHKQKGGESVVYGFGACGLPLVLSHNTPNNSVYLLWGETERPLVPLFSRMERHR